jgi:hypothetical protein
MELYSAIALCANAWQDNRTSRSQVAIFVAVEHGSAECGLPF